MQCFFQTSLKTPDLSYIEKNELDKHTCIDIGFVVANYQLADEMCLQAHNGAN